MYRGVYSEVLVPLAKAHSSSYNVAIVRILGVSSDNCGLVVQKASA